MKEIKLLNLKLTNFKGIKEFELVANGQDLEIYGQNEAGKTSVFDAFTWLLFNKGSNDEKDFGIKTLQNGRVVHNLNHEVEATLSIDGQEHTFKKVFKEKWTQKKGAATKEFTGHTTKHFINNVPNSKTEYDNRITELISTEETESIVKRYKKIKVEDVFKLLTVPNQFVNGLPWKERRNILLEVTGDISDEEVLESEERFAELQKSLNGNSIEEHKAVIANKKKEINKRLQVIPELVSENHLNMPDLSSIDKTNINGRLSKINTEIEEKNEQMNSIKNGSEINNFKKEISDIDLQIANVSNEHIQNDQQKVFKLQAKLQEEESNLSILQGDVKGKMEQQKANNNRINDIEQQLTELREQFKDSQEQLKQQSEMEFNHEDNCICPTCEQDLPEDKISEAKANFNRNKASLMEKIQMRIDDLNKKGPELNKKKEDISSENDSIQKQIDSITEQGKRKKKDIEKLQKQIEAAQSETTPIEENDEYQKLQNEKKAIKQKIEEQEQSIYASIEEIKKQINGLDKQKDSLQESLSKVDQSKSMQSRIVELETEQKELAAQYEQLEKQDYLIDEFTSKKVAALDEKVSKYFEITRFKMLEEQINGGVNEMCEPTYKGVPFEEGLNDGAKVSVGIDIINVLSKHFGIRAPIFFDNAEQVTEFLVHSEAQMIAMYASKDDKELRIETKMEKESEVA